MAATKAPPMIAPGVVCPKCKGPMLDERATKRTEKSPDYTCANMLCVQTGANGKSYRTAIWAEKSSGAENGSAGGGGNAGNPASAPPVESDRPKLTKLYQDATEFVMNKIVPMYAVAKVPVDAESVAAMVATLFIAASRER